MSMAVGCFAAALTIVHTHTQANPLTHTHTHYLPHFL